MSDLMLISTALCLPREDVEALSKGRMIVALSSAFINSVKHFSLCPIDKSDSSPTISTNLWAKLECCKIYNDSQDVDKISQITIWSSNALQKHLQERHKIFLLYLRVYRSNQAVEVPRDRVTLSRVGSFIKLPNHLALIDDTPVLSDKVFQQRKQQLINLEFPLHPELEELQDAVSKLANNDLLVEEFSRYIQSFLGWTSKPPIKQPDPKLLWINTISSLGDRSIEEKVGKKNTYEAGTDFENIVRDSLKTIGFKVDEIHQGGAGGIDIFCSQPYPLIGECKCGKSIPGNTAYELDKLADVHFEKDLKNGIKLIIGPGKPTSQLSTVVKRRGISIINPMTLQKLVELQAKHSGSVDLIKLKPYLEFGPTDHKVEQYIEEVLQEIKLRSYLVKLVSDYLQRTSLDDAGVDALHGAYFGSNPPKSLRQEELRELLIELSSPLTGYLGRKKGSDGSDRFYFLRDLLVD
jgi:hypothetical protein